MNNDLISREALKSSAEKFVLKELADGFSIVDLLTDDVIDKVKAFIDNAPSVETNIEVVAKDAYKQGYTDGWKERFGEPDERTQGEWVCREKGIHVSLYACSICGRTVMDDTGYDVSKDYPFCHCGADMQKGGSNG